MKEEYQDRIENYLLNRMSDIDRLAFERDLEKDAELRDQYEFISMVKTALLLENIEKDVTNWSNDYKEKQKVDAASYRPTGTDDLFNYAQPVEKTRVQPRPSVRKLLYWFSGIAAVFVVGVFVVNNIFRPSNSLSSPEIVQKSMSQSQDNNISFRGRRQMDIESLLAMGDYTTALAQIEKDETRIRMALMRAEPDVYSRGSNQGNTDEEQDSLENRLLQLLYWKANALIGLNRKYEAFILLDEIRHSESDYKEQADSLYLLLRKKR